MPNFNPEQPIYTLPQSSTRAVIPKILTILLLSSIFYVGILLNIALLEMTPSEETTVKLVSLVILIIIIVLGIYLAIRRAHLPYQFYHNKITFGKKEVYYTNIETITLHKDPADHIFKTYSLRVGNGFIIRNLSNEIQVQNYLQQLVQYAKRQV